MVSNKKVRLGVVGCGKRGIGISHQFKKHPQCEITALNDRFRNIAEKAAKELELTNVKIYSDFDKMLSGANVDAIFFACDPNIQADLACQAMRAGKHVCTEVPAAFYIDQCWELVKAVEQTGVKYQLLEQVRFSGFTETWKKMHEQGEFGHICLAQGEYVHYLPNYRNWVDQDTGQMYNDIQKPKGKNVEPSWRYNYILPDPIYYLPHTLSPILRVLNDRIVRVSSMGTSIPGYTHRDDNVPWRDIEYSLMHTQNDTLILAGAGFAMKQVSRGPTENHWWELRGTKGSVTTPRYKSDSWRVWKDGMDDYEKVDLSLAPLGATKEEASSGHGGTDFAPVTKFIRAILEDTETGMDVYKAVETAAPAILAVQSARQNGMMINVPDFRLEARRVSPVTNS